MKINTPVTDTEISYPERYNFLSTSTRKGAIAMPQTSASVREVAREAANAAESRTEALQSTHEIQRVIHAVRRQHRLIVQFRRSP